MPNVPNYAREMDKVLQSLDGRRPRLLLHACCGPCSSAVLEQLSLSFDITILYYNPNIWPPAEYHRREQELERFVAEAHPLGVKVVEDCYDPQEFYDAARGLENEPERGARCTDRKSTRLNSSHVSISYAVFCLKKKTRRTRR